MMTVSEQQLEQKRVKMIRTLRINAIDLIADIDPDNSPSEVGVALSQWTSEYDYALWPVFEAALEDSNFHSLIPLLKQAWDKWEKDTEAKWEQWQSDMEAAHDRFLDQMERDVF